MAYVGCQLKIETEENTYFGTCYHHDAAGVGLRDVTLNGKPLPGVRMFYQYVIKNVEVLSRSQEVQETVEDKSMEKPVSKKHTRPKHLNKLENLETSDMIGVRHLGTSGSEILVRRKPELVSVNERLEIESCDHEFDKAIADILKEDIIGLAAEGENLSRKGKLFWLQVATKKAIYLFDILSLGADCFSEGLKLILESTTILKVIHNCRGLSDNLFHIYKVRLDNVFDTQMASIISYRVKCGGDLPRYCDSLEACLKNVLNLSDLDTAFTRIRKHYIDRDQQTYAERPLADNLKDVLISNVMYLLDLRVRLIDLMLADFYYGVSLYLNVLRDAPDGDISLEVANMYMVPKNLCSLNERARHRREQSRKQDTYSDGFQENCSGIVDPSIVYSKDIWHRSYYEESKSDAGNSRKNFSIDPNQWHVPDLPPNNMKKNVDFGDSTDSDTAKKDFWGCKTKHTNWAIKLNKQPKTTSTNASTTDVIKFRPAGMLQKVSPKFKNKSLETASVEHTDSEDNIWRLAEEMRLKEEEEQKLRRAASKSSNAQKASNRYPSAAKPAPKDSFDKTATLADAEEQNCLWADTDIPATEPNDKIPQTASSLHDLNVVKPLAKPVLDTLCDTSKPLRSNEEDTATINDAKATRHVCNDANISGSSRSSRKKNRPRTLAEIEALMSAKGIGLARENKSDICEEKASNISFSPVKQYSCISGGNIDDLNDSAHVDANSFFALHSHNEVERAVHDKGTVTNVESSIDRIDGATSQDHNVTASKLSNSSGASTNVDNTIGKRKSPLLQTPPDYMRVSYSPETCVSKNVSLETQTVPTENRSTPTQLINSPATATNKGNTIGKRKSPLLETPTDFIPSGSRVLKDVPREESTRHKRTSPAQSPAIKANDYVQSSLVPGKFNALPDQIQQPVQISHSPKSCVSKDLLKEKRSAPPQAANGATCNKMNNYAKSKHSPGQNQTQTPLDNCVQHAEKHHPFFLESLKAETVFTSGHFTPRKQENFSLSTGIGRGQALKKFLQD